MQLIEYENKELKRRARAADIESLLEDMGYMESFEGTTEAKIAEHYYKLKRQLLEALNAELPKKE